MENTAKEIFRRFYPESLKIEDIIQDDDRIEIRLKSTTHRATCPECGCEATRYHSTYRRKLQDLPVIGASVHLKVTAYRYYCDNPDCARILFFEDIDGLAGPRDRFTTRLMMLVIALALKTNCEDAARVLNQMGVHICGDTIIHILLRAAQEQPAQAGSFIGIDDWAYRKGRTYGALICDGETHAPITLLDGRDGDTLKAWLRRNQQVRVVTRDRSSAFASAISEVLPEATQIADRFHLYQNLGKAIDKSLDAILPNRIFIPLDSGPCAGGVGNADTGDTGARDEKKRSARRRRDAGRDAQPCGGTAPDAHRTGTTASPGGDEHL